MIEKSEMTTRKMFDILSLPTQRLSQLLRALGRHISLQLKMLIKLGFYPFFSKKNAFFYAHFTALGLLVKATGNKTVRQQEQFNYYLTEQLAFNSRKCLKAISLFDNADAENDNFSYVVNRLSILAKGNIEVLIQLFDIFNELATIDGVLTNEAEQMLLLTMKKFKIEDYQPSNNRDPYKIIGCHPSDSIDYIKRCYRKKINEFHPDKLLALGLPKEFVGFASARFTEVQMAYEIIRKNRRF